MKIKNNLKKKYFVFWTIVLIANVFLLNITAKSNHTSTIMTIESPNTENEPTNKELVLLLIKTDQYWMKDNEGYYVGFDFESAENTLTAKELKYMQTLNSALDKIYTTAKANRNILELDLDFYPWNILFSDMKENGLESILLELQNELGFQELTNNNNNPNDNIGPRMSVQGAGYCNWWEIPWACWCGGGYIRPHPCPNWRETYYWFSSYSNAESYVLSLGYHHTAGYACGYSDYDFTKVVNHYGCGWGPIRRQIIVHNDFGYWTYRIQDNCAGISGCQKGEPNPEILSPWIVLCPTWWSAYVLWWHDAVC
ncbi:MAG: hypothetical protein ACFE9L_13510 [Candidatus Hodarchaeota archaeon]